MDVSLQNTYGIARRGRGDQLSLGNVVQIPHDVFRLCSPGYGSSAYCSYDGASRACCSCDGGQPSFERERNPRRVTEKEKNRWEFPSCEKLGGLFI